MKINTINNQNFEAKRLRVTVKNLDLTNPELVEFGRQVKNVNLLKEYSNPKDKILYNRAMKTNNIREKARLLSKMGDFELYDFGDGILGKIRMNIYLAMSKVTDLFS